MLYLASLSSDEIDIDTYAGVSSCLSWRIDQEGVYKLSELIASLKNAGAKNKDFIILTPSISALPEGSIAAIEHKCQVSGASIVKIGPLNSPYWTGAGLLAVRFDVLKRVDDIGLRDFKHENRIRYALAVVAASRDMNIRTIDVDLTLDHMSTLGAEDDELFDKAWYLDFHQEWIHILQNSNGWNDSAQLAYLYSLQFRLIHNANSKNKYALQGDEIDTFYSYSRKVLMHVNDRNIMHVSKKLVNLSKDTRIFLLSIKHHDKELQYRYKKENIIQEIGDVWVDSAKKKPIVITSMDYYDDHLTIVGEYRFRFDPEQAYLVCRYGDKRVELYDTGLYSSYKLFGREIYRYPTFKLSIPRDQLQDIKKIRFFITADKRTQEVPLRLSFIKQMSKLNNEKQSYWYIGKVDRIIKYAQRVIHVTPGGRKRWLYHEVRLLKSLLFHRDSTRRYAARIRILYFVTKPFFKKPIWIFYDKLYKGGDNGEYLYDFARNKQDGIKKHYVLSKQSVDVPRFRHEGKDFLPYGSVRHKLSFLNASIVFATHSTQSAHNGLLKEAIFLCDLLNYNTLFIQHGLTIQEQARILNKYVDNTRRYFVASQFEKDNLLRNSYGYTEADIITSGVPRYDGLISQPKKQILITPSWRSYLAAPMTAQRDSIRAKSTRFKDSTYFSLYNNLINDRQLLETATKFGYSITYLLHPAVSSQLHDFDGHDSRVTVLAASDDVSYEQLLTESDLMVTDYSGVQFDFAYMKKPIIYYHPIELPPSYEEAIYRYEDDALGEIVRTHKDIVNSLCNYMTRPQVPKRYKKRMDDFFFHHDQSSAERIYLEASKFQQSNENNVNIRPVTEHYKKTVEESKFIRHALGGIDTKIYVNSIRCALDGYKKGFRLFEADIELTQDEEVVLSHGWKEADYTIGLGVPYNKDDPVPLYSDFMGYKLHGRYPASDISDLIDFMRNHEDVYVLLDTGRRSYEDTRFIYKKIVAKAKEDSILQRFIVGGHTTASMRAVLSVYDFKIRNFYWATDRLREDKVYTPTDFVKYCEDNGIGSFSIMAERYTLERAKYFNESKLISYIFTTDDTDEAKGLIDRGASVVATNFLE